MSLDDEIDRLYQLPLNEFTAARNDLAKQAGKRSPEVRKLAKPPLAAWAVNQLYWRNRRAYDALIEASEALRETHKAVLTGKRADLRFAGKEHEDALGKAIKATIASAAESGHPVTDATRQSVAQTLRALPADEPPGRLSRALKPGGFEMLAGITVEGGGARPRAVKTTAPRAPAPRKPDKAHEDDRKLAQARDDAASAARALREAQHSARRAEFEQARAARTLTKAEAELDAARTEMEAARKRLEAAEEAATAAAREDQAARRTAEIAEREAAAASKRAEAADKALVRLTSRRS